MGNYVHCVKAEQIQNLQRANHYKCNGQWINLIPSRLQGQKQSCPY